MTDFNASVSHISMMQRPYGPRVHMDEAAASAPTPAASTPAGLPESFSTADDAARFLATRRRNGESQASALELESTSDDDADPGAADETELSGEDNAAPDEDQAHGDDEGQDPEGEDLPPIQRPKSWAKDEQAEWDGLTRSLQEKIAARETAREKAIRTSQNEAAESSKATKAEKQAAEQARAEYEAKAREALNILAREQQRDFADIKTAEDVAKLAQSDPLRYIQWDAHQRQVAATKDAVDAADRRKADDAKTKRTNYQAEQRAKLIELVPDLADQKKYMAAWERALPELESLGLSRETLDRLSNTADGSEVLFSAAFQKLIADSQRLADLQKASSTARTKPVPPVTRPGVKQPSGGNSEKLQTLNTRLTNSGSLKDAAALLAARRAPSRRSA